MSTSVAARRKNRSAPSALDAVATGGARSLGRGAAPAPATTGLSFGRGRGVGLAPPPRSRKRGGGSVPAGTPTTIPFSTDVCTEGGFSSSSAPMEGFPLPPASSSPWFESAGSDPSSPASWDKELHPSGGFMSYFTNQSHNSHLVGAMSSPLTNSHFVESSPQDVEIPGGMNDNVRTEKRILWTEEEDIRLMSAWIEHSTDSTCGADKPGGQY